MKLRHPGKIIQQDYLDKLNISVEEAADNLGIPWHMLYAIINENFKINADIALRLEKNFKLSAEEWLQAQSNIDLENARKLKDRKWFSNNSEIVNSYHSLC